MSPLPGLKLWNSMSEKNPAIYDGAEDRKRKEIFFETFFLKKDVILHRLFNELIRNRYR